MTSTKTETALERQVREEQEAHDELDRDQTTSVDGTASGPDADKGKLFEVPRVAVLLDESDPAVLKLVWSGSIELDRTKADDVAFYNRLQAGTNVDLEVQAFIAGAKKTRRRDSEGNVDAIVETKSMIVHSVETA